MKTDLIGVQLYVNYRDSEDHPQTYIATVRAVFHSRSSGLLAIVMDEAHRLHEVQLIHCTVLRPS